MRGREVSNRVPSAILEVAARRGIDPEPLVAGLSFDLDDLRDRDARCDWDDFTIFVDRLGERLGGAAQVEELFFDMIKAHPAMRLVGSLFISPHTLVIEGSERIGRRLYHLDFGHRTERLADGRCRVENTIPGDRRGCVAFHHASAGGLRAYPTLIGLPPAQIEAQITLRHAVFLITLPPSRTLLARAERLLAEPLSRFFVRGRRSAEPTPSDVQEAIDLAFNGATLQAYTQVVGQRLARHSDLRPLAEELQAILRRTLCSDRLGLWLKTAGGESGVELGTLPAGAALCSRALFVGETEVGRIGIEDACARSVLFEELLPWVSLGLENCQRELGAGPRNERLERMAKAWTLTPRQAQVLDLVVGGAANKEIATALDCSLKTVEAHVGQLLQKARADSRSVLIARFWNGNAPR